MKLAEKLGVISVSPDTIKEELMPLLKLYALEDVVFTSDNSKNRNGYAKKDVVGLNVSDGRSVEEVKETALHELAHVLVSRGGNRVYGVQHSLRWYAYYVQLVIKALELNLIDLDAVSSPKLKYPFYGLGYEED